MKYLTLRVIKRTEDEESGSTRQALLNLVVHAINTGSPLPKLVDELQHYLDTRSLRYREQLMDHVRGNEPLPVAEVEKRLRLLAILKPAQDGDVIAIEDEDHKTLVGIMETLRIPVDPDWVQFVKDVTTANDALPQITREMLAEPAPEHSENGRVLELVGSD